MSEAPIQDFFVKMVFFYRQTHPQKTYLHYTSHKSPLKPSVFVAQKWYSIKTNSQTISELYSHEIGIQCWFKQMHQHWKKNWEISKNVHVVCGIKLKLNFQLNHFCLAYYWRKKMFFLLKLILSGFPSHILKI